MSKHPNPSRLREMADKFEASYKQENILDFKVATSFNAHSCSTVACHAGWALIVLRGDYAIGLDFSQGITALNDFLEIKSLSHWATLNPQLWGNKEGGYLFSSAGFRAFGFDAYSAYACTLLTIADHYREVASRIEALGEIK